MEPTALTENAKLVLDSRYLKRDLQRRVVETPKEMFQRVARGVAHAELLLGDRERAERWEQTFLEMTASLDFLPNSPTLMNAGTRLGQLSACFVLPVQDTTEAIFDALGNMASIQRTGGGTGFSFSELRPRSDIVASTAGEASGPVSFMEIFDCATEHIRQGGKRRGANMGILRVDHPDIEAFVEAKRTEGRLGNFNLSVAVTDAFMDAARENAPFDLVNPRTGEKTGSLRAGDLFERIQQAAWATGDPGLLFLDAVNRANPTPHVGAIHATNPCGETPLLPFESCNLGSINLPRMLREQDGGTAIDWDRLRATVRKAVRFLDDVVEVNRFPVPELERMARGNRKIGLGVMGFSDMLIRLGISYDSDTAVLLGESVMKTLSEEALEASKKLASERGVFGNWKGSVYEEQGVEVRNATRTAIAPTGTIGIIAGASPSIEPLFALAYRRTNVLEGETLYDTNPLLRELAERHGLDVEGLVGRVRETGRLADVEGVPLRLKELFLTALEIPYERHLQMQAAFQKHTENSVSKTVNLPEDTSPGDVGRTYLRAWELGLKGITVFRYGSLSHQVLELGAGEQSFQYDHAARCDPGECRL